MDEEQQLVQYRNVALQLSKSVSNEDRAVIAAWAENLLQIRNEPISVAEKSKRALRATMESKVVWPIAKTVALEIKRHGWDERGTKSRFAIAGSVSGLALFGGHGAGIAALGTAVGVPLWIVLGAGGLFAGVLVEELRNKRTENPTSARQPESDTDEKL